VKHPREKQTVSRFMPFHYREAAWMDTPDDRTGPGPGSWRHGANEGQGRGSADSQNDDPHVACGRGGRGRCLGLF
jgi:hypothetical protein